MRIGRLLIIGLLALAVLVASSVLAKVSVGDKVEEITLEKRGGGTLRIPGDLQDKVVLLSFWASWCPECKIELPELGKLSEKFKGKPVVLLAVNADRKRKAADDFLEKHPTDLTVLYDTDQNMIRAFGPIGIPASYLIGPDGKVEKHYLGFSEDSVEEYRKDIEALLKNIPAENLSAQAQSESR